MCTAVYAKVWINGTPHVEVMADISIKQGWPSSHTIWLVQWWTWNIFGWDQQGFCVLYLAQWLPLFFMLRMLFYSSKSRASLQRLVTKLYGFCTLKSIYLRLKSWYLVVTKEINPRGTLLRQGPNWDNPWKQIPWDWFVFTYLFWII